MDLFHSIPADRGDETIRAALAATINRARANNLTPKGWSLAELHLGNGDVEWLQNWACSLDEGTARSWLLPEGTQGTLEVRRAAIGVLLLLLAAEQTRRATPRESDWATACSSCFNEQTRQLLFDKTEPTELYINSLRQAFERLHLRQNGGWQTRESKRENIALQIGLTEADLHERWPRWLRGEDPPEHLVQLLAPETGSPTFRGLWLTCQRFLQGNSTAAELRIALTDSPWILPQWVDSIVASLKSRKPRSVETISAEAQRVSAPARQVSQLQPAQTEDIFESLTPYGGLKTIIRATRAILARAGHFGLRGNAWSLAELRVTDYDYVWLKIWAKRLQLPTVWFSTETQRSFTAGDESISFRAGLGGLLLLWIAETSRRNAAEGELWPFIALSHFDQPVAAELFRKSQPSRFLREALAAAARELNLRHALDGDSTQCWLDTAYLQFGFTWQGFMRYLPEWLSGQAATRATRELLSQEHGSASFRELWQALRDFRQGHVTEDRLRDLAANNPWVLPEWIDGLVTVAREKPELEAEAAADAPASNKFLTEPLVIVDGASEPQLVCRIVTGLGHLNLTEVGYDLIIAGERRARLLRQSGGAYHFYQAEPSREIVLHSDSSRLAACLIGPGGTVASSCELVLRMEGEDPISFARTARLAADGWQFLTGNDVLTVEEARTSLFRIKPLQRRDSRGEWLQWAAMEGDEMVKRLNGRDEPFDSLNGLGLPLTVRSGPFNNAEDEFLIAASVIDRGVIESAVCESLPSNTGRLNTGRLHNRTSRVLRLKVRNRLEPGENHFVVWWNENGEIGRLEPHYCEDAEDGYWWVCKVPDTVSRFIAVAIACDGARLGAWWEDGWAGLLPPVGDREPLLTAALLRWFRLPVLSLEAAPIIGDFCRQYAAASLVAWLKGVGLPEWLRNEAPDRWLSAARSIFRLWWPDADTARQVLLALADARITDRLNDELVEVTRMLCRVDPLLLAAILKAVKDRIVICSPTEIRMRLADCETSSAYDKRKNELIASSAEAFDVHPDSLQIDLLDCADRWLNGYELHRHEECNMALAAQNEDSRLLVALHVLERI